MSASHSSFDDSLSKFRPMLVLLARVHLDSKHQAHEASDIAQEVIVDAMKYQDRLHDLNEEQLNA